MNKKKSIYFLSAFALIIGCYILNLSYSYFFQKTILEDNVVDGDIPSINANLEQSTFTVPANSTEVVTLKIINTSTVDIQYGIEIRNLPAGITAYLVDANDNDIVGTLMSNNNKEIIIYIENSGSIDKSVTFNLTSKYQTLIFDKQSFIDNSNIDCVNKVKTLNSAILARANDDSITDEERTIYDETFNLNSISSISGADERKLIKAEDDDGISYVYRGNVEDNYVNFAGMCWRIVRIAGDGSTKLILEDQYTTCDDTETETTSAVYTGNWNIGKGNYGYELKNVDSDSMNEYIMNYLKPVRNNTSSMVKIFYDFQTTKLADYTSKLKSGDWCLGDKAYTQSGSSGSYTYTPLEVYNYIPNMWYDARTRLTSGNANGYQPTLRCNGTVLDKFATVSGVSSEAPMYVSTITADETVLAGGKFDETNDKYYLINEEFKKGSNGLINSYYLGILSPYRFDGTYDKHLFVFYNGTMDESSVNGTKALRPSVSLASGTVIKEGGEGTLENPYIIV